MNYKKHVKSYVAKAKKWRQDNPARWKEHSARCRAKKPDQYGAMKAVNQQRRAAKFREAYGDFCLTEWDEIKMAQDGHCWWCGKVKPLTIDHVIPLSKHGPHIAANIVGACRECNSRKKDSIWPLSVGAMFGQLLPIQVAAVHLSFLTSSMSRRNFFA